MTKEAYSFLENDENDDIDDEPMGMADAFMMRGEHLRQLRLLEEADRSEREEETSDSLPQEGEEDQIDILPNGQQVLRYNTYLAHQRYYDDLKHVDCSYIDFYGAIGEHQLVIQQDKCLGKGGLCWDAAFILGEHLILNANEWTSPTATTRVVELGAGTGLCGLMLAKAVSCHVHITDLPELMDLLTKNLQFNFSHSQSISEDEDSVADSRTHMHEYYQILHGTGDCRVLQAAKGSAKASVLRWGTPEDYQNGPYDVVVGADVVASLYDPISLAETIHALCHDQSIVYISYKGRLTEPHQQFEERLRSFFSEVQRIQPASFNKNPEVWILKATGKQNKIAQ